MWKDHPRLAEEVGRQVMAEIIAEIENEIQARVIPNTPDYLWFNHVGSETSIRAVMSAGARYVVDRR